LPAPPPPPPPLFSCLWLYVIIRTAVRLRRHNWMAPPRGAGGGMVGAGGDNARSRAQAKKKMRDAERLLRKAVRGPCAWVQPHSSVSLPLTYTHPCAAEWSAGGRAGIDRAQAERDACPGRRCGCRCPRTPRRRQVQDGPLLWYEDAAYSRMHTRAHGVRHDTHTALPAVPFFFQTVARPTGRTGKRSGRWRRLAGLLPLTQRRRRSGGSQRPQMCFIQSTSHPSTSTWPCSPPSPTATPPLRRCGSSCATHCGHGRVLARWLRRLPTSPAATQTCVRCSTRHVGCRPCPVPLLAPPPHAPRPPLHAPAQRARPPRRATMHSRTWTRTKRKGRRSRRRLSCRRGSDRGPQRPARPALLLLLLLLLPPRPLPPPRTRTRSLWMGRRRSGGACASTAWTTAATGRSNPAAVRGSSSKSACICLCACVCMRVHVCMCVCMCACVRATDPNPHAHGLTAGRRGAGAAGMIVRCGQPRAELSSGSRRSTCAEATCPKTGARSCARQPPPRRRGSTHDLTMTMTTTTRRHRYGRGCVYRDIAGCVGLRTVGATLGLARGVIRPRRSAACGGWPAAQTTGTLASFRGG
jgi:hypothetical protein